MHAVLERLFDLPAAERTPQAAAELVEPQWLRLVEETPRWRPCSTPRTTPSRDGPSLPPSPGQPSPDSRAGAVASDAGRRGRCAAAGSGGTRRGGALAAFLAGARGLLDGYFAVEDPRRLEPAERETLISTLVDDELLIRGYIDRLDVSPAGDLRVVDYKTGGAPREAFEARALFQLKFYALVLWRTRGVVPKVLRLLYLKDAEVLDYAPDERGAGTLRAHPGGALPGDREGQARQGLPGEAEQALRLVQPPAVLPGVRRDAAAVSGTGRRLDRRERPAGRGPRGRPAPVGS